MKKLIADRGAARFADRGAARFADRGAARLATACLACLLGMTSAGGCHRGAAEAEDAPAMHGEARAPREAARLDGAQLQRPHALVNLLSPEGAASGEWLQRLLGLAGREPTAFRLEARTVYDITPPPQEDMDTVPARLNDEMEITTDRSGGLHIVHNNDHGYGVEAIVVKEWLYMKMRYGPFLRRRPEDDEIGRLLASADNSDAIVEVLSPFLQVGAVEQATVSGRPVLKLPLSLRSEALPPRTARVPGRGVRPRGRTDQEASRQWRRAAAVQELAGIAVFDPEQQILLGLQIQAAFTAPRPLSGDGHKTAPVQVRVNHRMSLVLLDREAPAAGQDTGTITPPAEWMETPMRPRPMLDRQELLEGLVRDPRRP